MASFKGLKSLLGGSGSPTIAPDTLFSDDVVELVMGICEGQIEGLYNGAQSIYLGGTPLVNSANDPTLGNDTGTDKLKSPNFGQFSVDLVKGASPAEVITPSLGGFGNPTNVSVNLDTNTPVVRTGLLSDIDAISVRILFNELLQSDSSGNEKQATASFQILVKPHSATDWTNPYASAPPSDTANPSKDSYYNNSNVVGERIGLETVTYVAVAAPPVNDTPDGAVWFDSGNNYTVQCFSAATSSWSVPANLSFVTASPYSYWTWTDPKTGATMKAFIGSQNGAAPFDPNPNDLWINLADPNFSGADQTYAYNKTGWAANVDWTQPPVSNPGVITITAKCTSPYVKEILIPVQRISEPYDVQVTKLTAENTQYFTCDLEWDSFTELKNQPLSFPDLAFLHMTIKATDQFNSLPQLTLDLLGTIVKVPSNYDPVARTYAGVWDGTWKMAYSNNTAYVAYDLITNDRYGVNAYYALNVDPDTVYAFGQHCDAHGFTYNELIADDNGRPLNDAVNNILGTAGGLMVDYGDGSAKILFDSDTDPAVALFANENVSDGVFEYSFTDITSRRNDLIVSYVDSAQNWITNQRRVFDQTAIDTYGDNREEFIAAGCIDETEAIKRARLRLVISQSEKTMVTFKTNRLGLYLQPYDVILIADSDVACGLSGRISAVTGSNSVSLRDAITLEAGFAYQLQLQLPSADGFEIFTTNIVTGAGTTKELTLADELPSLPDYAQFAISCSDVSVGVPKAYRINAIEESDGDPDLVTITAIEVNRSKWAYVDGTVPLTSVTVTGRPNKSVLPPTNVQLTPDYSHPGELDLVITWSASPSPFVRFTRIYVSQDGGQATVLAEVSGETTYTFKTPTLATYLFSLVGVDIDGVESIPVTVQYKLGGDIRVVLPPTNLHLSNGATTTTFNAPDAHFAWTDSQDPFFDYYIVEIHGTDGTLKRSSTQAYGNNTFIYTLGQNVADFGAPTRAFQIVVYAVDKKAVKSQPAELTAENPAPAAFQPGVMAGIGNAILTFAPPSDTDYVGTLVWVQSSSTFDPSQVAPLYDLTNTQVTVPVAENVTLYACVAGYDCYGKTGLNYGPIVPVTSLSVGIDTTAPNIPTGLAVTSALKTQPDGSLVPSITASWNADTSGVLGYYDVEISENGGGWISFPTNNPTYTWTPVDFGQSFQVQVRALSKNQYPSSFCTAVSITSATKTTPPGDITNPTHSTSLGSIFLSWTNPSDQDIDHVEIWEADDANFTNPRKIGSVSGENFVYSGLVTGSTHYLWAGVFNTSGIESLHSAYFGAITLPMLGGGDIADGAINATAFASGIQPVGVVNGLPVAAGYVGPLTVFNTQDGKLYRYVDGAWTRVVDGGDISPTSIQTGSIAAGAIKAAQIDAGAITANSLSIGTSSNMIPNSDVQTAANLLLGFGNNGCTWTLQSTAGLSTTTSPWLPPQGMGSAALTTQATPAAGTLQEFTIANLQANGTQTTFPIVAGQRYEFSVYLNVFRATQACLFIDWYDSTGNLIGGDITGSLVTAGVTGPLSNWGRSYLFATAPANAGTVAFRVALYCDGENAPNLYATGFYMAPASPNQTALSPWQPAGGSVITGSQIVTASITGTQIQAHSISSDHISTVGLDASVITAGSSLNSSILVGSSGVTIGGVQSTASSANSTANAAYGMAANPAPQINANSTLINPGLIQISGATTLANWRNGSDTTKIEGGSIAANTISANKITIGSRGISTVDLQFSVDKSAGVISWNSGYVLYTDSNGNYQGVLITANSASSASGWVYIYWPEGATYFLASTDWPTATAPGNVLMASYSGWTGMSVFYGQSIIDGLTIVTGTITGTQIAAITIQASNIAAGAITAGTLAVGTSGNMITNSDARTLTGFIVGYNNTGFAPDTNGLQLGWDPWHPYGMGSVCLGFNGNTPPNGTVADIMHEEMGSNGGAVHYPCVGGQFYEFSAYVSNHRCNSNVFLYWYDAAGNNISATWGTLTIWDSESNGALSGFQRSTLICQAPSNAAAVTPMLRTYYNGTASCYTFTSGWFLAPAQPNQTTPSAWSRGGSTIINGQQIVTGSITANQIAANSITADRMTVGALSAISANVGTVTAGVVQSSNGLCTFSLDGGYLEFSDYS